MHLLVRGGCEDCFLTYDASRVGEPGAVCASILNATRSISDADARAMAERAREFVFREFRHDAVEQRMLEALGKLHPVPEEAAAAAGASNNGTHVVIKGRAYARTTCGEHLARHTRPGAVRLGPCCLPSLMMSDRIIIAALTSSACRRGACSHHSPHAPSPCPFHLRQVGHQWQLREWFAADTCAFRTDRDYLNFFAL